MASIMPNGTIWFWKSTGELHREFELAPDGLVSVETWSHYVDRKVFKYKSIEDFAKSSHGKDLWGKDEK